MAGKEQKRSPQGTPRQAAHRNHRSAGLLHSRAAHVVLLAALSFAVYANALRGEFVFDDNVQLVRNADVRSLENLPRAFTTPLWSFADTNNTWNNRYYRPMQTVIFAVVYQFAGLSPFAYHLASPLLPTAGSILAHLLCIGL